MKPETVFDFSVINSRLKSKLMNSLPHFFCQTLNRVLKMGVLLTEGRNILKIDHPKGPFGTKRDPTTGQSLPPDQLHQVQHTRRKVDGQLEWADPQSELIYDDLRELRLQQEEVEVDARMTSDEILTTVLGERSGYVRGKGYGAEPLRKRNRSHSSDNAAVETVRTQLLEEFDKKFQEERAKMEAESAEERARIEAERAEERAQFDDKMKQMEERILAILMPQGQVTAPTSATPGLAVAPADRSS